MESQESTMGELVMYDHYQSFYSDKKILLTGNTGFKGTWLSRLLLGLGASVYGYALAPEESPSLFGLTNMAAQIDMVTADIRDLDTLEAYITQVQPDIVFHMAAQPLVRKSFIKTVETYSTNVMGTVHVLEALRNCRSVRSFVNVTTDKVYRDNGRRHGYCENEELCGDDPYSNSKSCSELITYSYNHSFFYGNDAPAISTARSGNVIGGGDYSKDRIIPDCIKAAMSHKDIIVRNPFFVRPYQHVLECLNGYLLLAMRQYENKQKYAGCYNFGPLEKDCINTGDLVDLFCKAWPEEITWRDCSDNGPRESTYLSLDITKARTTIQWRPVLNIQKAVDLVVEWVIECSRGRDVNDIMNQQIDTFFNQLLATTSKEQQES